MLKRRRVGVPPRMAVSDPAGARLRGTRGAFSGPIIVASMGGRTGARALRSPGAVGSQKHGEQQANQPRARNDGAVTQLHFR